MEQFELYSGRTIGSPDRDRALRCGIEYVRECFVHDRHDSDGQDTKSAAKTWDTKIGE